jgi:hypothetical protein
MADRRFQPSPDHAGEKELHVADLLPFVLPVKSLTINSVADVADFLDLSINLKTAKNHCPLCKYLAGNML